MTPIELAILFHDTYERLAPEHGYETRPDTRTFDPDTGNGRLMVAVCAEILAELAKPPKGCQRCCSHRPFHTVHDSDKLGTVEICLTCGHVQGKWPHP